MRQGRDNRDREEAKASDFISRSPVRASEAQLGTSG